ncbi:serine/arginine repetitive matrix protein 1 isoform X1 [Pseudoliparis swirei]|uniref:serine/arginine repetitive matrix protein 1 isoform X1 n=1 Tax=Pseudoliparis swirei TaxID=2059687 RepID=UPI0024BD5E0F|nr:serine/arginine repetitive matrix protein 1 isoform X1 [Pseudoliparis swirei]
MNFGERTASSSEPQTAWPPARCARSSSPPRRISMEPARRENPLRKRRGHFTRRKHLTSPSSGDGCEEPRATGHTWTERPLRLQSALSGCRASSLAAERPLRLQSVLSGCRASSPAAECPLRLQSVLSGCRASSPAAERPLRLQSVLSGCRAPSPAAERPLRLQSVLSGCRAGPSSPLMYCAS